MGTERNMPQLLTIISNRYLSQNVRKEMRRKNEKAITTELISLDKKEVCIPVSHTPPPHTPL
jgi:hypothetical protein